MMHHQARMLTDCDGCFSGWSGSVGCNGLTWAIQIETEADDAGALTDAQCIVGLTRARAGFSTWTLMRMTVAPDTPVSGDRVPGHSLAQVSEVTRVKIYDPTLFAGQRDQPAGTNQEGTPAA
jgi:hypothetical protein